MSQYPIGYSSDELARLSKQSDLLKDEMLTSLIIGAKNILDLGCGSGANINELAKIFPEKHFLGVDIDMDSIRFASKQAVENQSSNVNFQPCDLLQDLNTIDLKKYDLVIIRLVLWALGPKWKDFLKNLARNMKEGTTLYSFEPEDRLLLLTPPSKLRDDYIKTWQQVMLSHGFNPFIGSEVAGALDGSGLRHVSVRVNTACASKVNAQEYDERVENLRKIFMSSRAKALMPQEIRENWDEITNDFKKSGSENFMADSYVITVGKKA